MKPKQKKSMIPVGTKHATTPKAGTQFKDRQLIFNVASVIVKPIHLRRAESQDECCGPAVTDHALRPAGIVPWQFPNPCRSLNGVFSISTLLRDQDSIGLLIVPDVRIPHPFVLLTRQESSLNPALCRCISFLQLNSK